MVSLNSRFHQSDVSLAPSPAGGSVCGRWNTRGDNGSTPFGIRATFPPPHRQSARSCRDVRSLLDTEGLCCELHQDPVERMARVASESPTERFVLTSTVAKSLPSHNAQPDEVGTRILDSLIRGDHDESAPQVSRHSPDARGPLPRSGIAPPELLERSRMAVSTRSAPAPGM